MKIDSPFLLDTNILVYAADTGFEFHDKAKEIRDKAVSGDVEAYITPQVLAEFYSVITSPKRVHNFLPSEVAKTEVESYLNSSLKMIFIKESTIRRAIEFAAKHSLIPIMLSNSALKSSCHCERSEAIPLFRLLRHLVPRNDNPLLCTIEK